MKTIVVREANGPFAIEEQQIPSLAPDDVLVRIHAASVNPLDTKIRAAAAEHAKQPLPAVLGLDMAGVIELVGADVTDFRRGDEVYGMVGGVGGRQGTLAQYIAAPAALLARKSSRLSMVQAAALPLITITAWEGIVDRAQTKAGHSVLVYGGSGGVGQIAIQLAVAAGAKVFATASEVRRSFVEQLGATWIDIRTAYVDKYTAGEGFDVIYDTAGGSTLDMSFQSVKIYTGHVVSCLGWGRHALAPLSFRGGTYSGVFTLLPMITGRGQAHHGEILSKATEFADVGKLAPTLANTLFTSDTVEQAFERVSQGSTGKVVVDLTQW